MKTRISNFSLSKNDIDSLPSGLRTKFSESLDELDSKEVHVVLIKTKDDQAYNVFRKTFETTVKIYEDRSTNN